MCGVGAEHTRGGGTALADARIGHAYLFERRQVAGAVPKAFLKARENAASDPYPTMSAICASDALVLRSFWVATCMRQLAM
jgi:hypothetical protein